MEEYAKRRTLIKEQDDEYKRAVERDALKEKAIERESTLQNLNEESPEDRRKRLSGPYEKGKTVMNWDVSDVVNWLQSKGLRDITSPFEQHEVDGPTLLNLTKEDIREELKISRLDRRKLLWEELSKLRLVHESDSLTVAAALQQNEIEDAKQKIPNKIAIWNAYGEELHSLASSLKDCRIAYELDKPVDPAVLENFQTAKGMARLYGQIRQNEFSDANYVRNLMGLPLLPPSNDPDPNGDTEEEEIPNRIPESKQEIGMADTVPPKPKVVAQQAECLACAEDTKCVELACQHFFCIKCLASLFLKACKDVTLMPPACCKIEIDPNFANIILAPDDKKLFQLKYLEATTVNKIYCPNRTCSVMILLDMVIGSQVVCPSCFIAICVTCRTVYHNGLTCAENKETKEDEADKQFVELAQKSKWKQCPACKGIVELASGCNHMTCLCKHEFCYMCGMTWRTCKCDMWDEAMLVVAEQRVPEAERNAFRNVLRGGECVSHRWHRANVNNATQCENCSFILLHYGFRCDTCRIRVCFTCRFHRIVN